MRKGGFYVLIEVALAHFAVIGIGKENCLSVGCSHLLGSALFVVESYVKVAVLALDNS